MADPCRCRPGQQDLLCLHCSIKITEEKNRVVRLLYQVKVLLDKGQVKEVKELTEELG